MTDWYDGADEALLQYTQVSALPRPEQLTVENLRLWIKRGFGGQSLDAIRGKGATAWGDINEPQNPPGSSERFWPRLKLLFWPEREGLAPDTPCRDLVKTQPRKELDSFTHWVEYKFTPFWHGIRYGKEIQSLDDGSYCQKKQYSQSTMIRFTSFVAAVIACLLPTVAIGILTTAQTTRDKLLYIGSFTALFSIGLLCLTEAGTSRVQVFTATAAFSAVLVVFVQGQ